MCIRIGLFLWTVDTRREFRPTVRLPRTNGAMLCLGKRQYDAKHAQKNAGGGWSRKFSHPLARGAR